MSEFLVEARERYGKTFDLPKRRLFQKYHGFDTHYGDYLVRFDTGSHKVLKIEREGLSEEIGSFRMLSRNLEPFEGTAYTVDGSVEIRALWFLGFLPRNRFHYRFSPAKGEPFEMESRGDAPYFGARGICELDLPPSYVDRVVKGRCENLLGLVTSALVLHSHLAFVRSRYQTA